MNTAEYEKIVFKGAFCVMACDGQIHEHELNTIKDIAKNSPYFLEVRYEDEMTLLMEDLRVLKSKMIKKFTDSLDSSLFSNKQKYRFVEVLIRVIKADGVCDKNEVKFLQTVTSKLNLLDEELIFVLLCFLKLSLSSRMDVENDSKTIFVSAGGILSHYN